MKQLKARKSFLLMILAAAVVMSFALVHSGQVFASQTEDTVWLHVINGNFSGMYDGKDIRGAASVEVKLEADRTLPKEVENITVSRTNGKFAGWYTKSAHEVLADREDGAYCVWHTEKKNGEQIVPGSGSVPENVNVLYAVFDDKAENEVADSDKLVTYYLDWNGINGKYGECLTSIRSYNEGEAYFKADSAAVYSLNFGQEYEKQFEAAADKWGELKNIWEENQFGGYTFLGWSKERHGETIWADTKITNRMTFYAQWKKGELSSNEFEPAEDPAEGPLKFIRITGDGMSSSLSAGRHAKKGESMTLTILSDPIRASVKDVTWSVSIGKGGFKTEKLTVQADETTVYMPEAGREGLELKAQGRTLTIKNLDGGEYGITVGVTAKDAGEDGQTVSAPADASLSFSHTWDQGNVTEQADCETSGKIHYTCTAEGCGQEKDVKIPALEHVYEKSRSGEQYEGKYYEVLKRPTCTEAGEKQYKCLRCKKTAGAKASIPATGHHWEVTDEKPLDCQRTQYTDICTNPDCGITRTREEKVSNPDLHEMEETIIPINCSKSIRRELCTVCGKRNETMIDCSNPGEEHVWENWKTTTAPTLGAPGLQTRVCELCREEETRVLPQLAPGRTPSVKVEEAASGTETLATGAKIETETPSSEAGLEVETSDAGLGKTSGTGAGSLELPNNASAAVSSGKDNAANAAASDAAVGKDQQETGKNVVKTGWQTIDGKKYYFNAKGVMQKNGIKTINGKKYYFDKKGVMKTGWQTIGKKKYYFNAKGVMQTNGIKTINGKKYYFDKKGVMKTGWQTISKKKYYFDAKGVMQKNGFKTIKGKKYYFDKNGVMKTGKLTIGGKTYTFRSNGVLLK